MRAFIVAAPICCCVLTIAHAGAQSPSATDRAFAEFWRADDPKEAERAAERILKTGIGFETAYARLKVGRSYAMEKTGQFSLRFPAGAGVVFENGIEVPTD